MEAYQLMQRIARDPAPWTHQLVILRSIQTLSVLDLETYLLLAARLGEYDRDEIQDCRFLISYPADAVSGSCRFSE